MDRRGFLTLMMGLSVPFVLPLPEADAAGETTALLKLIKSAKSNDMSTLGPIAEKARKIGWQVPTKGSQLKLLGPWNFTTSKSDKGEVDFVKGGKLTYGKGPDLPFNSWEVQTSGKNPALLVMKGGGSDVYFQYFQRSGVATLSNLGNRKQWIVLTVR